MIGDKGDVEGGTKEKEYNDGEVQYALTNTKERSSTRKKR